MTSPRHLVLRNLAKAVARMTTAETNEDSKDPPLPNAGDMQLYSYYKPALVAAEYTITTTQGVVLPGGDRDNPLALPVPPQPQVFEVVAPQFTLDPKVIHSTYPPAGHADEPRVLPHVVLTDPHLPWERPISSNDEVPWLALLPFDPTGEDQELRLSEDQLNGTNSPFKKVFAGLDQIKQETSLSLKMPLAQYFTLPSLSVDNGGMNIIIPPFSNDQLFDEKKDDQTIVDVIFLTRPMFNNLFLSKSSTPESPQTDLTRYKYLAHVRNVNTAGMTDAGVEDTGLFSIVHSHRTGPVDIQPDHAPRSQIVHLISLEFIDEMKTFPVAATDLVALISLYSWTYLCQPPLSVNFVDSMAAIGVNIERETSLLRCPDSFTTTLNQPGPVPGQAADAQAIADYKQRETVRQAIADRLSNGYSLIRQRAATGEQTVAFTRGALVPVAAPRLPSDWPLCSNNGQEYQILDRTLGILDVSYSSAWQLGKTIAVADSTFVAALMRIRGSVHASGIVASKIAVARKATGFKTKAEFMASLKSSITTMQKMSKLQTPSQSPPPKPASLSDRLARGNAVVKPNRAGEVQQHAQTPEYKFGVRQGVIRVSAGATGDGTQPGSEINPWTSNDWAIIHNWILDRMYLAGIPNHYLVTDPTHLCPERLRFFHIDPVWMGCFIDGALSVANHLSRDDDNIRQEIKQQFNTYLTTVYDKDNLPWFPQVPVYGFFLRSKVVSVFPDLRVEVPWSSDPDTDDLLSGKTPRDKNGQKRVGKAEVLLQRHMGKDVMLCLLDRLPDSGEIARIRISQPPHQQRFSAGDDLDTESLEFEFRKIFRELKVTADFLTPYGTVTWKKDDLTKTAIYDWKSRCLDMDAMNQFLFNDTDGYFTNTLTDPRKNDNLPPPIIPPLAPDDNSMRDEWNRTAPANTDGKVEMTSAFAGLQLNDPVYYLDMLESSGAPSGPTLFSPGNPRTLRATADQNAQGTPGTTSNPQPSRNTSRPANRTASPPTSTSSPSPSPVPSLSTPQRVNKTIPTTPVKRRSRSSTSIPPHLRTIAPHHPTTPPATPHPSIQITTTATLPASNTGPAILPQFIYSIRPSTTPFIPATGISIIPPSFIYTDTPYGPDLIFSITLNPSARTDLFLHEVQVSIPLGPKSWRLGTEGAGGFVSPGLMDAYTGPGARMLSNQRWVLHHDHVSLVGQRETFLVLRLIPRTLLKTYPITVMRTAGLSFMLSECLISRMEKEVNGEEKCHVKVTEIYRHYTSVGPDVLQERFDPQGTGGATIVVVKKKGWTPG
jgi:hypothetical protein